MTTLIRSKLIAAGVHLLISATVVGAVLAVVFFVWYPQPLFEVRGAWTVVQVLIFVDVILGPFLTLLIYRRGKPRLAFDLSVIALVQVIALLYGTAVIFSERPYVMVFAVDRFVTVTEGEIDTTKIDHARLGEKPWIGPLLVAARPPTDPKLAEQLLFEILDGGPDVEHRPEHYWPYGDESERVLAAAFPITGLTGDIAETEIQRLLRRHGGTAEDYVWLPLMGRYNDFVFVLDKNDSRPVGILRLDPWEARSRIR